MQADSTFYNKNDEIDLFELVAKLYKQKTLIIVVALLAGIIATIVALNLPKTYSSKAIISQSSYGQFQALNSQLVQIGTAGDLMLSPQKALNLLGRQLTSQSIRRQAFEQTLLAKNSVTAEEKESAYKTFQKNLKTSLDKQSNTPRITIDYSASEPQEAANIINQQMLQLSRQKIIQTLEEDQKTFVLTRVARLKKDIAQLENSFQKRNEQNIVELRESLAQAKAAGIDTPIITVSGLTAGDDYLLGAKLLESRIKQVQNRVNNYRFYSTTEEESDDSSKPYIQGVSAKVYQINQLLSLNSNYSSLKLVNIEQPALAPSLPSKPRKSLIVALGLILGGMLGIFIALVRIALIDRKTRKRVEEQHYQSTQKLTLA